MCADQTSDPAHDYRSTVFLPETPFPMRAGLPQREPGWLARWERIGVYDRLRSTTAGRPPFILHDGTYANVSDIEEVFDIGLNRAVTLLAEKRAGGGRGRGGAATPLKDLGAHPETGEPIHVMAGRFGPYVKSGKINATLPKGTTPEDLTLEVALPLLAAKAGAAPKKKAPAKKAAAPKKAAAKSTTKKPAAKKATAKKTAAE